MKMIAAAVVFGALASSAAAQDAAKGKRAFEARCAACHSLAANRVGPALGTVIGRSAGSHPGFAYSAALKAAKFVWDEAKLQAWLQNPQAAVPGAAMPFRLGDAEERKNIAAYLASLRR